MGPGGGGFRGDYKPVRWRVCMLEESVFGISQYIVISESGLKLINLMDGALEVRLANSFF